MRDLRLTDPSGKEVTVSQLSERHLAACIDRMRAGRFVNSTGRPNRDIWDRLQIEVVVRQIDAQGGI